MCTTGAIKINGSFVLFKNRDPVRPMEPNDKPNIFEGKVKRLIVSNNEGSYAGLNEYRIGVVCSFVEVLPGDSSEQARIFLNILPNVLETKTFNQTINNIKNTKEIFGANFIVANPKQCYFIEYLPNKKAIKEVKNEIIKTNHFSILEDPRKPEDLPWNFKRYKRANQLIKQVKAIEDIKKLLADHKDYPEYSICNHGNFAPTGSSYILDLKNKKILHCLGKPCEEKYKEYIL